MDRFGLFFAFIAALVLVLVGTPVVYAQDQGVVNAMSHNPLPEGLPILVRPLDNSAENLKIKKQFETVLAQDGYVVATDSSFLVLSFETRRELGGGPTPRRQVTDRMPKDQSAQKGMRYRPQIAEGQPSGPTSISRSRYRLDATLDDKQSNKRLWRGWAIAPLQGDDTSATTEAMVKALVGSIDHTVSQQPFAIEWKSEDPIGTR
jgi:hypothetical protein